MNWATATAPLAGLGRFFAFCLQVGLRMVTPPWEGAAIVKHTTVIAARCALPVFAVVFPTGMVMALQGLAIFELFGAQRLLSSLVTVAVFREVSPVLASTLVAAQGGSSYAAEVGAMRIKEELDATVVMGVDPLRVHVVPRVIALMIATPCLNFMGSVAGIIGGYVTATVLKGEPGGLYIANVANLTTGSDILGGFFKTFVFGTMIGLISTYHGFYATGGAPGVGRAVNDSVVISTTSFIVVNYFLTTALFGAIQ